MKRNILKLICGVVLASGLVSCESIYPTFDDFEGGTTVYFPYQYPVRTIVLGDDEYDTSLDLAHKCLIKATFGGSYDGSNGSVQVAVDESLVDKLTFADGTPVKAMPANYYTLSTTTLNFNGTMNGMTEVQLSDAFFNDPDAVKETYVIPLLMTGQNGFGKILTGKLLGDQTGSRSNDKLWDVQPMDFVLYCVKYQNKYTGWWLTHGTTSTENIEKAQAVEIRTRSLNSCVYTVKHQNNDKLYTVDLTLTFDESEKCTISLLKATLTQPINKKQVISDITGTTTVTGNGAFGDNTEKKAWGNKDRDGLELNYTVSFDGGHQFSTHEKLVWQRSGVTIKEFKPVYTK